MTLICPQCEKDVTSWLTKAGRVRKHNRPVPIPGGVAAATCSGWGALPKPAETPAWITQAFTIQSRERSA